MGSCNPLYRVRVSSSGLIYAVIVGAWAAYLVPMWLRRQDELNEARPTERFSTAIRLLSGKAGMERRYAKDAERREAREARETDDPSVPDARGGVASARSGPAESDGYDDDAHRRAPGAAAEEAVDVRGFADPKTMVSALGSEMPTEVRAYRPAERPARTAEPAAGPSREQRRQEARESGGVHDERRPGPERAARGRRRRQDPPGEYGERGSYAERRAGRGAPDGAPEAHRPHDSYGEPGAGQDQPGREQAAPGSSHDTSTSGAEARAAALEAKRAKQAKRARLLARRRRTTMLLFLGFTAGAVVAAVGGLALLWAPAVPALLLSAYIAHLRSQERRRFASAMDRQRAEAAAHVPHERGPRGGGSPGPSSGQRQSAHREVEAGLEPDSGRGGRVARTGRSESRNARAGFDAPDEASNASEDPHGEPSHEAAPGEEQAGRARSRAEEQEAAERRALVEQTDHAEWVDQQRARDRENAEGEGWEPVPVPLPTYVSAPVAPRTTRGVDLEAPDTWSSARSSTVPATDQAPTSSDQPESEQSHRPRRTRDRNRTPLFDQYEQEERPRAANE